LNVDESAVKQQSIAVYKQFGKQWKDHAKIHADDPEMKNKLADFFCEGVGRAVLCIANGYSFEENLETIKKYQDQVDIMVCDKTLGSCLDAGIKPTYCMVCDANVDYEKYLEPWASEVSEITLLMNVCANPSFSQDANWKNKYYFVNMDAMKYEVEFAEVSGCTNLIPAGTNVSNAMVIMLTQSDNTGPKNFFGYDKILLIGFDYCWDRDGYYSFNKDGNGKMNYMRHVYLLDARGKTVYTSTNLHFSAAWFNKYATTFKTPLVQCSKRTIFQGVPFGELSEQMQYSFQTGDRAKIRHRNIKLKKLMKKVNEIRGELKVMGRDHYLNYRATI